MPRLGELAFVALLLLVVALGPQLLNVDGDLGRHLTLGEEILHSGRIPTLDVFSHTRAGEDLTPHEWLSDVLLALAFRGLGLNGVVLLCGLVLSLTFTGVYKSSVGRSGLPLVSLALTFLAAAASSLHWLARPHLFTLLMVVLWTDGLERMAKGGTSAWWRMPLLMLAWANLHGAFVLGFVIWLAYAADWLWQALRRPTGQAFPATGRALGWVLITSLAATLANPVGLRLWTTSIGFVGNAYLVGHTAEYLSPNFHEVSTWPFLAMILVSPWILAFGRPVAPRSVLLILGWTALGLYSVRHVPVSAVVAAPILAHSIGVGLQGSAIGEAWRRREQRMAAVQARLSRGSWASACVAVVAASMALGVRLTLAPEGNAFSARVFPIHATDYVLAHPPGQRVFNYFPWGGYLLFRGWPDLRVFIDGQTDFYGEALTRQYETVITLGEGWEDILDQYAVDWVIMPADSRLVRALLREGGWSKAYADATAMVLTRGR